MSSYVFDSHKLMYHPERISEFFERGDCYPLYMEVSPVGKCNHRCIFCAYDYLGYPDRKLDTGRMLGFISEAAEKGLKSILFAGEGEPLLHPDIDQFITHSRDNGIDSGLFTNGQLLTEDLAGRILPALTFVRFSFNGGTADNYSRIHQVSPGVFTKVIGNIQAVSEIKKSEKLGLDIGAQYVVLPENIDYIVEAAACLKSAGIDYFAIKPFVQQSSKQGYQMSEQYSLEQLEPVFSELEKLADDRFSVVIRRNAYEGYGKRSYCHCLGTSFITAMNSGGDIASCLPYWENEEFVFGNIYESSYEDIWNSVKRLKIKHILEDKLDVQGVCPPNCRPHAINMFLSELAWPTSKHINFV